MAVHTDIKFAEMPTLEQCVAVVYPGDVAITTTMARSLAALQLDVKDTALKAMELEGMIVLLLEDPFTLKWVKEKIIREFLRSGEKLENDSLVITVHLSYV